VHEDALSWEQGTVITCLLGASWAAFHAAGAPRARSVRPWAREACIISALYTVWQLAERVSLAGTAGAFARATWIEQFQRTLHLPAETGVQALLLSNSVLTQVANYYYATMHFGGVLAFLIWLFVRYRRRYAAVRTTLALATLACLLLQLWPVAPPRLMDGFVDTAARYGQSVYSLGLGADQLSAMPSMHVAWAVFVSFYLVRIGRSRWRWLFALHAPVTIFVVIATANHWWLDVIAAVGVLVVCAWLRYGLGRVMILVRLHARPALPAAPPKISVATTAESGAGG
jgi:hypothetical protein